MSDMGTFRTDIEIENPARPGERQLIRNALVDTGSELTWIPAMLESIGIVEDKRVRFRLAKGVVVERRVGLARVYAGGTSTGDDVVFAEPGDSLLLGARSLEGLNLRVDPVQKVLIDAGPAPAAALEVAARS
jgi:predicted aspartyl protease